MNNHLQTIEIKDFKCFKDFKAKGLKRVNLIGGKNNVGKTAFMEACHINTYSKTVQQFYTVLFHVSYRRYLLEYVNKPWLIENTKKNIEKIKYYKSYSNVNSAKFKVNENNGIKKYQFTIDDSNNEININEFSFEFVYMVNNQYIPNFGISDTRLKELFVSLQKKDSEDLLYKYINEFDKNILNFKVLGGEEPVCKTTYRDDYQNINEFGDGLKHYISIICALYACENGYLFIDEIDNGIHYTQLDRLWEIILTISKEQNVQVFATTHSKECIESFARVAKKLEDEDISFIELGKDKNNKLKAMTFPYKWFIDEIEQNHEVRGW